ncbi:MAG: DUF3164 family protein [Kiritimatiellia bacterium]|jgi:hypothetical protein
MTTITTPDGKRLALNAAGAYVPLENIREIDIVRDELVTRLATEARRIAGETAAFRDAALEQAEDFRVLSAQDHDIHLAGSRGGYSLQSFDGRFKIVVDSATLVSTNEKVSVARDAILSCVRRWSEGANAPLVELVSRAFEVDKQGHLSVSRLLALRSYRIEGDAEWDAAMEALSEGLVASGSKTYLRFYERQEEGGAYVQIPCG